MLCFIKKAFKYPYSETINKGINYSRRNELRRNIYCLTSERIKNCLNRYNFFRWNKLRDDVVNAKKFNSSKAKLDVKKKETTDTALKCYV